ncbi:tetratricopeptide repeat protein [Rhizomicrobium electricum]|nr:tetratricopeptide repeat protein [Rhizomicrobium electricum]NIJ47893.1 putative O-linked N-acetylglucosamine transferase (SPINDLY family) [Rhizomicrobium electricum]
MSQKRLPNKTAAVSRDELMRRAIRQERARRPREALESYAAALKTRPSDPAALTGVARCAMAVGDLKTATAYWRKIAAFDPQRRIVKGNLAAVLLQSEDLVAAEEETQIALVATPQDPGLKNLLGVIQKRRGRFDDAIATFREGTEFDETNHSFWYNLGNTLFGLGRVEEAIEPLRRAFEIRPTDSETARVLGQVFASVDQIARARIAFDHAERLDPKNLRVHTSRAALLQRAGADDAQIIAEFNKVIGQEPDNLDHQRNKALFLQRRSRFAEAEAVHRDILKRDPDDIETLLRLGHMLGYSLRRYEEANGFLRHALELRPEDPRCLSGLCKSLLDSRYGVESDHVEEAGQIAKRLLATGTDMLPHAANLSGIFLRLADFESLANLGDRTKLMSFWVDRMNVGSLHNQLGRVVSDEDRLELVRFHRQWGKSIAAQAAKLPIKRHPRPPKRDKIRIGFMSSDLRDHPVAYFVMPMFELYDRNKFEIYCYSFYPAPPDRVQSFITQNVAAFRTMLQATDQEIAQRIHDDDLDILIELGGSTRYNRLEVMAYHAAPIQVSWLGYPHSAGIEEIDYILVDPYLKPDDPKLLIEKPFQVPESWVVLGRLGFRDIPIEPGLPEDRAGALTFGTMNNPYKYTPEVFGLWARCMQRFPKSRFLFVRPEAGAASFRANICKEFAKHGVEADRILFESIRGRHLPHYNRIDIALDTAPHVGGTTTCETLWMGVPTITLVGKAFFERLSYSNLNNAGLGDLCAFTPDEYVAIAEKLGKDKARRLDLRQNLRTRLRTAPLGDAARWVRNFEATIVRTVNDSGGPS